MFDIPVTYQIVIVASVLVGLAVWLTVFASAERRGPGRHRADTRLRRSRQANRP